MKIMMQCRFALLAVLGCATLVNYSQAQGSTFLYLANAVPGRSVATATPAVPVPTPNPAFPVDFKVGSICIAKGVSFGQIRGPLSWPAGVYDISFTPANAASPCTGDSVFSARVTFAPGTTYIGVLTLDSANAVTGQMYTADLSPISVTTYGRIEIVNASQDILVATLSSPSNGTAVAGVGPGNILEANAASGLYTGTITTESGTVLVGPINVQVEQRDSYIYVLTGSTANNSVQLVGPAVIKGIF